MYPNNSFSLELNHGSNRANDLLMLKGGALKLNNMQSSGNSKKFKKQQRTYQLIAASFTVPIYHILQCAILKIQW